ncbi:MAG: outer membrane protein transport protein [Polyangia bacterium]
MRTVTKPGKPSKPSKPSKSSKPSKPSKPRWKAVLLGITLTVAVCAWAGQARAAGFLIYELSGEAVARGSAVSADVNEPAAVWFNPAALSFSEGIHASAGGVFVTAKSRFSPAASGTDDVTSKRGNFVLPTLFASGRVNDRVAVGMGVYTAFGIGVKWPSDWLGRESAISASLQTVAFNPAVSFKLHPRLSVAVGFDAVRGVVDFSNGLPVLVGGDVRLAGAAWGYGGNAGLLYQAVPDLLHLALTYRSRVRLKFDGRADFRPANPDFGPALPDQPGTATITLPDIITVGVMGRPRADLALTAEASLVLWSTYDRIDIDFQSAPNRSIVPHGRNAFTVRAGADWTTRWPGLHLRGGLIFDQAAVTGQNLGPGLPDANRIGGALGAGYARGHFKVDVGYLLVYCLPAEATGGREGPAGTYYTLAHLVALTVAASWP